MQIITTRDGSHTLYSEQFNEIYHSRHGAIQESLHVFIKHGLEHIVSAQDFKPAQKIKIFEVGFGTGLNALLTLIEAEKQNLKIHYEAIELYPLAIEVIKELNYTQLLENEKYRPPFHSMHLSTWDTEHQITPSFTLKKINDSIFNSVLTPDTGHRTSDIPSPFTFHLLYLDAFAPEHQPEMWTADVMRKMYGMLMPGGVLVSYCSKSSFQRALKEAGFMVEKLPGPPGKREMIRAVKKLAD